MSSQEKIGSSKPVWRFPKKTGQAWGDPSTALQSSRVQPAEYSRKLSWAYVGRNVATAWWERWRERENTCTFIKESRLRQPGMKTTDYVKYVKMYEQEGQCNLIIYFFRVDSSFSDIHSDLWLELGMSRFGKVLLIWLNTMSIAYWLHHRYQWWPI